ncbi:MAG: rhomboid family intramembrane serine protease [Nitrospiraceae bacterium]|nr:rhomboid family intramembrane serine protease [Nitrospiraceae bacterium]
MIPLKDTIPNRAFPSTTWMLIILCGVVFLFETTLPQELLDEFTYYFGIVPVEYTERHRHGLPVIAYLSFLTTMFLHGGWLHFLGNMWFLKIFGSKVEDRMGHGRFLLFYLIVGILASISYVYFSARSSMPVIGASGAIAGVMGAYYVLFPRARILTLIPVFIFPWFIELPAVFFLGWWFLIQLFAGTVARVLPSSGGGTAWWGHIGGFIAGVLLVSFFLKNNRRY